MQPFVCNALLLQFHTTGQANIRTSMQVQVWGHEWIKCESEEIATVQVGHTTEGGFSKIPLYTSSYCSYCSYLLISVHRSIYGARHSDQPKMMSKCTTRCRCVIRVSGSRWINIVTWGPPWRPLSKEGDQAADVALQEEVSKLQVLIANQSISVLGGWVDQLQLLYIVLCVSNIQYLQLPFIFASRIRQNSHFYKSSYSHFKQLPVCLLTVTQEERQQVCPVQWTLQEYPTKVQFLISDIFEEFELCLYCNLSIKFSITE